MAAGIRLARKGDLPAIGQVAESAGLFPASMTEGMGASAFDEGEDFWMVAEVDSNVVGFTFVEPERLTDRAWNMRALAVSDTRRREGIARELVRATEQHLESEKGRLMVVDTTNLADQEAARAFYEAAGYAEAGRIPDFFEEGTDKVTFIKRLRSA